MRSAWPPPPQVFKLMDADNSGLITLTEFERTLREDLRLSLKALPQPRLHRLWLRLDENLNGSVDAGEVRTHTRATERNNRRYTTARTTEHNRQPKKMRPGVASFAGGFACTC
jgi:hypothetical protein